MDRNLVTPAPEPYVPLPVAVVLPMLQAGALTPGQRHLDLGSGDGRICQAAQSLGAQSVGIEHDPSWVAHARAKGLSILAGDFWDLSWTGFDLITAHVDVALIAPAVRQKFRHDAAPGARLVIYIGREDDPIFDVVQS